MGSKGSTTMHMAVGPWSGLHRTGIRVLDDNDLTKRSQELWRIAKLYAVLTTLSDKLKYILTTRLGGKCL